LPSSRSVLFISFSADARSVPPQRSHRDQPPQLGATDPGGSSPVSDRLHNVSTTQVDCSGLRWTPEGKIDGNNTLAANRLGNEVMRRHQVAGLSPERLRSRRPRTLHVPGRSCTQSPPRHDSEAGATPSSCGVPGSLASAAPADPPTGASKQPCPHIVPSPNSARRISFRPGSTIVCGAWRDPGEAAGALRATRVAAEERIATEWYPT
jgi:hypothetical protein